MKITASFLLEKGSELFNKTNGLSTVFKLILNEKTKPDVVQKALFTLGNAVLQSGRQLYLILTSKNNFVFHFSENDSFDRATFDSTIETLISTFDIFYFMALVSFYATWKF